MSNALATISGFDLTKLLPAAALANIAANFDQADESFAGGDLTTLSLKGREFGLKHGGSLTLLPERAVDIYLVGIRPVDHFVFYDSTYDENTGQSEEGGESLTRDVLPSDPKDFVPFDGWLSRARKRRCILMLANDTEQRLVVADFGAKTLYQKADTNAGLFNLSQLMKQMAVFRQHNNAILPFMFKLQMSFTRDSVPVVQFSFMDQATRSEPVRSADPAALDAIAKHWESGEVERLLNVWFDDATTAATPAPAVAAPASVAKPAPVAPKPAPEANWVPQDSGADVDEL